MYIIITEYKIHTMVKNNVVFGTSVATNLNSVLTADENVICIFEFWLQKLLKKKSLVETIDLVITTLVEEEFDFSVSENKIQLFKNLPSIPYEVVPIDILRVVLYFLKNYEVSFIRKRVSANCTFTFSKFKYNCEIDENLMYKKYFFCLVKTLLSYLDKNSDKNKIIHCCSDVINVRNDKSMRRGPRCDNLMEMLTKIST